MKNKEELKTLKDFELKLIQEKMNYRGNCGGNQLHARNSQIKLLKELKAEAIKDIKIIKEAGKFRKDLEFLHTVTSEEANAIISYIIWKNNLTEEELKNEK